MSTVVKNVRIKDGKLVRIHKVKPGQTKRSGFARAERDVKSWQKQMKKPK